MLFEDGINFSKGRSWSYAPEASGPDGLSTNRHRVPLRKESTMRTQTSVRAGAPTFFDPHG